jgi:hypothetical protein
MTSASAGTPVRLIAVTQMEPPGPVPSESLEPLVKSIASSGILQPLLVRKRHGAYQVIAGQKRLAAALAAGLKEVPCLVHQVADADCAALATAANLRAHGALSGTAVQSTEDTVDLLDTVSSDLARIGAWAGLMRTTPADASVYAGVGLDLIEAQVWRTTWMLKALTVIRTGVLEKGRDRSLAGVIDQVIDGFEPERRLRGLEIHTTIDGPASARIDDEVAKLILSGAILMMVESLRVHENPAIEVRVSVPAAGTIVIEVRQWAVAMAAETVRAFAAPPGTPGVNPALMLWASTLKAAPAQRHGTAELLVDEHRGGVLRCTLRP